MTDADAAQALRRCCASDRWVQAVLAARPFESADNVRRAAREAWRGLGTEDYLEAFAAHPRIGEKRSLSARYADTASLAAAEQSGVDSATAAEFERLRLTNRRYESKFGFRFIVCASGKTAAEILDLIGVRLTNDMEVEVNIAAAEQLEITLIRLDKIL